MKRPLKVLIPAIFLVLFGGCLYSAYLGFTPVEYATHVDEVPWLPEEASDISYYRSYSFTAYEFDISESGFRQWAQQWGEVKPIEERFNLLRYTFMVEQEAPPYPDADSSAKQFEEGVRRYEAWRDRRHASITDGYYYAYEQSNGGGLWLAYDAEKGRAYYHSSPR